MMKGMMFNRMGGRRAVGMSDPRQAMLADEGVPAPSGPRPGRPMPRAWMANGGLVGDACGCTGTSGGTGGTRSRQDYRK